LSDARQRRLFDELVARSRARFAGSRRRATSHGAGAPVADVS